MAIVTQPGPDRDAAGLVEPVAVVGVDTHTDTHTAALVGRTGGVLAQIVVSADPAGAAQVLAWAAAHTPTGPGQVAGPLWWAVEGTRSHGIGLTRHLLRAGQQVLEAPRPRRRGRRTGKSDALDALAAARAVLAALDSGTAHILAVPRADGDREALRHLLIVRRHYSDTRTATVNLLKSLILTADDPLREALRGLSTARQVTALVRGAVPAADQADTEATVRRTHLAELAADIRTLNQRLYANEKQLTSLIKNVMPSLLAIHGVGPVTAAVLLTTWSHHGRCRHEAAYAALAGVNPIPASSGRTDRHRLNRGGDRQLNAALHTILNTRRRNHQPTIDYINRRRTDPTRPRTNREITRSLKRYLARHLYRHMQTHTRP
jgi:transposase